MTTTFSRRTIAYHSPINSWIERSRYRGKLVSHTTFGSTGIVRGTLWAGSDPSMIGFLGCPLTRLVLARSWCQAVSMVMGLLDNGTPELRWFRAQNSMDRRVATSPLPKHQPPRGARWKCGARPLSAANGCMTKKCFNACIHQRVLTSCMTLEVCRWITSLVGGSSTGESKSSSYGVCGIEHTVGLKRRQNGAQGASAPINQYIPVSVSIHLSAVG